MWRLSPCSNRLEPAQGLRALSVSDFAVLSQQASVAFRSLARHSLVCPQTY